jgi:hypothetical protein|tara:strand:+ start:868 stop:1041 length:174 start_codon:yes stop_codon:yes gene_type:complete
MEKEKKSDFELLLDTLHAKYMLEGMSDIEARMKAVMSDEAQAMIFPNGIGGGGSNDI